MTPAGEAMHARLSAIVSAGGDTVLKGFSPQEIEKFVAYLNRVIDNIESATPPRREVPAEHH